MALKDALKSPPQSRTGFRSKLDVWRESLDEADRSALDSALTDDEWQTSALTRVIEDEGGIQIGASAVRSWRARMRRELAT